MILEKKNYLIIGITIVIFTMLTTSIPLAFSAKMGVKVDIKRTGNKNNKLKETPIDFGNLLISRKAGEITMDKAGSITFSGGILQAYGFPQVGTLTIKAKKNTIASITIDPIINLGKGVTFTPVADKTILYLGNTAETIKIYGSINFDKNTKTENLQGILSISIDYN